MKLRLAPWLLSLALLAPFAASAQISLSINIGPPPLPVYVQPALPAPGYIWTPGYWAWDPGFGDYYWVPGTWVQPPQVGYLWTPGYWGFVGANYVWNAGYWGNRVGFYGGINYGYGYTGRGYQGGRWDRGVFNYNRSVNNVNTAIVRNVYNTRVTNYTTNRVSFNGGNGGVALRPTAAQMKMVQTERRVGATENQIQQERLAATTPAQRATVNRGVPQVAATPRPAMFSGAGVVQARNAATVTRPAPSPAAAVAGRPAPAAVPGRPVPPPPTAAGLPRPGAPARPGEPAIARPAPAAVPGARPAVVAPAAQPRPATVAPQARPAPTAAQVQPRPAPVARPAPPPRPQADRPQPQARPQAERPQPQARPQAERPQPQARPQVERPQPQARPQAPPQAERAQPQGGRPQPERQER